MARGRRRAPGNYKLFSGYSWYIPGVGQSVVLLLLLAVGTLIGIFLGSIMTLAAGAEFFSRYGMLVIYPVQFLPAMMYAMSKSRSAALFETGRLLDSNNFGAFGAWVAALLVSLATAALAVGSDFVSYGTFLLTEKSQVLSAFYDTISETMKGMVGGPLWVSLLSVSVMAPFFEEWLCRGMILRGLLSGGRMKPVWAIVVSALIFAVIHMNPWQAVPAFLLGCLFGYVYYKTGSLKLTMLMHCVNNTFSVILAHTDRFADVDYFALAMPKGVYVAVTVVSLLAVALVVYLFSKIPLQRSDGNMDTVNLTE